MLDLWQLPWVSLERRLSCLLKRALQVRTNAILLNHIRSQLPALLGGREKQVKLSNDLENVFASVSSKFSIPPSHFPSLSTFRSILLSCDLSQSRKLRQKDLDMLDEAINVDIPFIARQAGLNVPKQDTIMLSKSQGTVSHELIESPNLSEYLEEFESLGPSGGKLTGAQVKGNFLKSGLPSGNLYRVWNLSDVDGDGLLDLYEFALAKKLISLSLSGAELPRVLPFHLKKSSYLNS